MPEIDDADGSQPHLKGQKKMPKVPKEKVKEACNHTEKGDEWALYMALKIENQRKRHLKGKYHRCI